MSTVRVSLAQVSSGSAVEQNLEIVEEYTRAAAAAGAALVVFPEAMMRRFGLPPAEVAEPLDGPWATRVRDLARAHGITVVAGMFTPSPDGRVYNTLLVAGPGTDARYDKIHLFDAFGFSESRTVAPGSELLTVTLAGVNVGFATCYDVRFPGLFQELAARGAELIIVPASWGAGERKVEQWSLLVRARALDATAYVAACGQADPRAWAAAPAQADAAPPDGAEKPRSSAPLGVGHSMVCGPAGELIGALGSAPGLLTLDLDMSAVAEVRARLPVLANRRAFD